MKKVLSTLLIALCAFYTQAQGFKAGPKIGANYAKAWNEIEPVGNGDFGGQIGGLLNASLDKKGRQAVQFEALFAIKNFTNARQNAKLATSYVDLPVLYQYNFIPTRKRGKAYSQNPKGNFYLTAGAQTSILLSSKVTFENREGGGEPFDAKSWTRSFDASALAGLGYKFMNGLTVEARYGLGLRHLHAADCAYVPYDASLNTVQASVAYTVPVKFTTRKY
ncbi:MAG TPA: porin family protein [Adhaeribacter sp.]|nr:porin family protein [Adhaeribacter sp.]